MAKSGWYKESARHSLAARGIPTSKTGGNYKEMAAYMRPSKKPRKVLVPFMMPFTHVTTKSPSYYVSSAADVLEEEFENPTDTLISDGSATKWNLTGAEMVLLDKKMGFDENDIGELADLMYAHKVVSTDAMKDPKVSKHIMGLIKRKAVEIIPRLKE